MAIETLEMVKDPVCDMEVEPGKAPALREVENRTYYFCSEVCAERFDEDPGRYVYKEGGTRRP